MIPVDDVYSLISIDDWNSTASPGVSRGNWLWSTYAPSSEIYLRNLRMRKCRWIPRKIVRFKLKNQTSNRSVFRKATSEIYCMRLVELYLLPIYFVTSIIQYRNPIKIKRSILFVKRLHRDYIECVMESNRIVLPPFASWPVHIGEGIPFLIQNDPMPDQNQTSNFAWLSRNYIKCDMQITSSRRLVTSSHIGWNSLALPLWCNTPFQKHQYSRKIMANSGLLCSYASRY